MSMRTTWSEDGAAKAVTAPVSLIVSAFAPVRDVRATLTPLLRLDGGARRSCCSTSAAGRRRLGGSALAQVYDQLGNEAPDLDDPRRARRVLRVRDRASGARDWLLAYHDSPTAACSSTLAEMAFASRCGLDVVLDGSGEPLPALFAEELGAVVQVRDAATRRRCVRGARDAGIAATIVGKPAAGDRLRIVARRRHAGRRASRRPASRLVGDDPCAAARCATIRKRRTQEYARIARSRRSGHGAAPDVRSGRGRRRAVHRHRRAAAGRDPARAGRQRPGRDGRGVRPRRLRRLRRAHERPRRRPRSLARLRGHRRLRRLLLRRRARRRARAGPSPSCSTRACATSSPRSSRAATSSRSACATAAR